MKEPELSLQRLSRRGFIKNTITATGATLLAPGLLSGCQAVNNSFAYPNADVMDEALDRMSKLGPFGNHCPMAAEALVALERPEQILSFVESYKRRFRATYPDALQPINSKNWKEALGRPERNTDWITFFNVELKESDWQQVITKWTDVLAAGLSAAAGHGVIRTCHAVRSLSVKRTELRLRELAEGLAYWAAYYQPLPESRNAASNKLKPQEAIASVPLLPSERRAHGSLTSQIKRLEDFPQFGDTVNLIDTTGKVEPLLSAITETFALTYLQKVTDGNNLGLLHAVTATTGLRSLLPYLSPASTQRVLQYGWQAGAAFYSIAGTSVTNKLPEFSDIKKANLVERAVATKEEHAIKLTEACLREHALNPNPVYLQAAQDSLNRLPSFS